MVLNKQTHALEVEMVLAILVYIGIGILALLGIVFLLAMVFILIVAHYAQKFIWNMPIMKWVTLEDLAALNVPKIVCMAMLMLLYEKKRLEIRLREDVPEIFISTIEEVGFTQETIRFHEFRMTIGPRRRKKKLNIVSFLKKFFPDLEPPTVPA